jgi:2-methylcitrate dehydratase PrpD
MVCVPESVRQAPKTIVEAQFSIPFTVAAALIDGPPMISHFTAAAVARPDILALARRVHPYVDQEIDRDWNRFVTPARLDIQYSDGKESSVRIDYPKGHPRHRMTAAELTAKTADCANYAAKALAPDTAERLAAATLGLDHASDLDALLTAMS